MSERSRAQRWAFTGLLAALACGGLTTREDEQAAGGLGAGSMVTPGQGASPAAGGVSSSSGGSLVGVGGGVSVGGKASYGKGGSVGSAGSPAIDSCPSAVPGVAGVISHFEGDTELFDGGGYYVYQDTELGGTTYPDARTSSTISPTQGALFGKALYFSGEDFPPESWSNAGFGVWLHCVDVSGLVGLRFWVASSEETLDVGVTTTDTQSTELGGNCTSPPCVSNFVRVETDSLWTEVTIRFEDLAGGTVPFEPQEVVGIDFNLVAPIPKVKNGGFDVWVDELYWIGPELGGTAGQPGGFAGYAGAP